MAVIRSAITIPFMVIYTDTAFSLTQPPSRSRRADDPYTIQQTGGEELAMDTLAPADSYIHAGPSYHNHPAFDGYSSSSGSHLSRSNSTDFLASSHASFAMDPVPPTSKVQFPQQFNASETTLTNGAFNDGSSFTGGFPPSDEGSSLYDEKYGYSGGSAAPAANSFLAVPELRQRQMSTSSNGLSAFIGGFGDPNAHRYSSAVSVASSDREATSEAWIRRQRIKPGRAKTKKVKLTKGRFIAEFGQWAAGPRIRHPFMRKNAALTE